MKRKSNLLITGAGGWFGNSLIKTLINSDFLENFSSILISSIKTSDIKYLKELKNICTKKDIELNVLHGYINSNFFIQGLKKYIYNKNNIQVIYAASVIHANSKSKFWEINYTSLKKFINCLNSNEIDKFVYISSNSPFGFSNLGEKFNENSNYSPIGNYGITKMAAEILLKNNFKKDTIRIIRPPWFHGNNMPERQKLFYKKVINRKFPLILPGNNKRSIINTADLSKATLNILCLPTKFMTYCVCEPESISMIEFIRIIQETYSESLKDGKEKYLKKKFRAIYLPPFTSSICLILDRLIQSMGFYSTIIHVVSELGMNIEMSSKRYRKEFPNHKFSTINISIYEELKEALQR